MINKIQKYLLTHYPSLWNIRLVPMLLIILGFHVFFFLVGYFTANVDIRTDSYSFSPSSDIGLWFPFSIFLAFLLLIGWLIVYMRNNSIKAFYPRKTIQLYGEWVVIFLILVSIGLFPMTLNYGNVSNWRSLSSYQDAKKKLELLDQIQVLMPSLDDNFKYDKDRGVSPIPLAKGEIVDVTSLDLDSYAFEYDGQGRIVLRGYIGPSILFYNDNDSYYSRIYSDETENPYYKECKSRWLSKRQVVKWFENGQQDSIRTLMNDFVDLVQVSGLNRDISVDKWFNLLYTPPYFVVSQSNLICDDSSYKYYNYDSANTDEYYCSLSLPRSLLNSYYSNIIYSYENDSFFSEGWLVILCFAMMFSIMIFSFRITSGKSWILALILSGVLFFLSMLMAFFFSEYSSLSESKAFPLFLTLFWISIFVGIAIYIYIKVASGVKGRSAIFLNLAFWLYPFIIPFVYILYYSYLRIVARYSEYSDLEDNMLFVLWCNLIVTFVLMLGVANIGRKWKSLYDE